MVVVVVAVAVGIVVGVVVVLYGTVLYCTGTPKRCPLVACMFQYPPKDLCGSLVKGWYSAVVILPDLDTSIF